MICKTEDIAYLDTPRPFVDLIETTSLRSIEIKNALSDVQNKALSTRTPLTELFKLYNAEDDIWEDFGSTTFELTDRRLRHVLRLTGKNNLDEARTIFMSDATVRLAVQLGNADSVSWLISHLGRQLHTRTP